jgi:2,4-dienoyl-CoA reductase-like NADH-dependent reductase (Old Yellow Enzyme family)
LSFAEISGGGPEQQNYVRKTRGRSIIETGYSEATWGNHVKNIRDSISGLPLIIVDGIRSRATMDVIVGKKVADLISMSKPFINEPNLVDLLKEGQERASCIDCRKCISRENFAKTMLRCFYKNP